ncbi:hypothetical protein ACH5RR_000491 [Cinchona calisaya]|uniref:Cytochrome P450 n=1 Tax=Cinchona calisaya TaxID=153742 RepID=A0ABD3B1B1_9GENT
MMAELSTHGSGKGGYYSNTAELSTHSEVFFLISSRQQRRKTSSSHGADQFALFLQLDFDKHVAYMHLFKPITHGFENWEPVNLTEKLFDYTSLVVCRAAIGRICKNKDTMINNVKLGFSVLAGFNLADVFPSLKFLPMITGLKHKLLKVHHEMDEVLEDVIKQHKANHEIGRKGNAESGDEDLIDVLLKQQESGLPSDSNHSLKHQSCHFISIEWALSDLMRHPEIMAKVQAEVRQVCKGKKTIEDDDIQNLKYLKMVIQETLRLHPPAPLIPRSAELQKEMDSMEFTYAILNPQKIVPNIM